MCNASKLFGKLFLETRHDLAGATRDGSADIFRSVRQWHDEDSLASELLQLAHRQATTDPTTTTTHYCTTIERLQHTRVH
jgi:hypothetical protein